MSYLSLGATGAPATASRSLVKGLFVASCLLSIVSWYTTQQGMALYLSTWFALLASLGVQSTLVLVAWLVGFTRTRRGLLISVYVITAVVSVAFSYVSLYTWFSARHRPATVQRNLYETLNDATDQSQKLLADAIGEGQKHVLALREMTAAEKAHGYISRAEDADPYLGAIRQAVAREAQTYSNSYTEGTGAGLRYNAFDRYASLARQSVERMEKSQQALTQFRAAVKPLDSSESQLRAFREAFDAIPWTEAEQTLHAPKFVIPSVPSYTDFVDRSATDQEDLLLAFQDLLSAPTNRHVFAFALAAFIDIIIFLLAYAAGPFFFGSVEERWYVGAAALDGVQEVVFVRDFLRKLIPADRGLARVEAAALTAGERQLCLLLAARGKAVETEHDGRSAHLIDQSVQEHMMEWLSEQRLPLRAAGPVVRGAGFQPVE